jgi:glucose/arabinose dehydrogenase
MAAYRGRVVLIAVVVLSVSSACSSDDGAKPDNGGQPDSGTVSYEVVVAFPGLTFTRPVDLQDPGDGSGRLFVVEQEGRIIVFPDTSSAQQSNAQVFLDIRGRVNSQGNEEGLLGLAFPPDVVNHFFVYYTLLEGTQRKNRVSRFSVSADPNQADPNSEQPVITIDDPYSNHNGGQIAFGPDEYLYIGFGDGGSANDPANSGQDRTGLLGDIVRIDVDSMPYAIPPDNPFVGNSQGYREEIYAWGLRNPWRFSFDPVTGWLWCGDVGQNQWEEIDLIEKGKNYGWKIMEGFVCRPPTTGCNTTGLEPPIWVYEHGGSGASVTGGYVYRGSRLSGLVGAYIYADYISGEIWALRYTGPGTAANTLLQDTNLGIASFGVNAENELFICAFNGKIYTLAEKN